MEFFKYIFSEYNDNLLGMAFAYIGVVSIVVMFLPKNNFISKLKELIIAAKDELKFKLLKIFLSEIKLNLKLRV